MGFNINWSFLARPVEWCASEPEGHGSGDHVTWLREVWWEDVRDQECGGWPGSGLQWALLPHCDALLHHVHRGAVPVPLQERPGCHLAQAPHQQARGQELLTPLTHGLPSQCACKQALHEEKESFIVSSLDRDAECSSQWLQASIGCTVAAMPPGDGTRWPEARIPEFPRGIQRWHPSLSTDYTLPTWWQSQKAALTCAAEA